MPQSKKRKPKKAHSKRSGRRPTPSVPVTPTYNVGKLKGSHAALAQLLDSDQVAPDQLVDMLLPLLWLYHNDGMPGNACVDGSMVLHYAYAQFGITATPTAADVVVANQKTGKRTFYGRPDPYWQETSFHGHCVLWLPQSGRFLDATVEQYPEIRRYRLGPIIGRVAASAGGSPAERAALQRGELPPGTAFGVQREDLMLLYTTAAAEYANVVTEADLVGQTAEQYRRVGINLASHALALLRIPDVAAKARRAAYPRLHALMDAVGDAEPITDPNGDISFTLPVDGSEMSLRLDELDLGTASTLAPAPSKLSQVPQLNPDPEQVQRILEEVDTEARALLTPTVQMGGGVEPVVLFEPRQAVGMSRDGGPAVEAQSEAIIAGGFARFTPDAALSELPGWSLRHTATGIELWDQGGIWARAKLEIDDAFAAAAVEHGAVRVLYGVRLGVRAPEGRDYTDTDRDAELRDSRQNGIAAAARVSWWPRQL